MTLGRTFQSSLQVSVCGCEVSGDGRRLRSILVSVNGRRFVIHVILQAQNSTPSPSRDHPSCRRLTAGVTVMMQQHGGNLKCPAA